MIIIKKGKRENGEERENVKTGGGKVKGKMREQEGNKKTRMEMKSK